MQHYSRWSLWEQEVLSKCSDDPDEVVQVLRDRQGGLSESAKFAEMILDAVEEKIAERSMFNDDREDDYLKETQDGGGYFISSAEFRMLVEEVTRDRLTPHRVAGKIKGTAELEGRIWKSTDTNRRGYFYKRLPISKPIISGSESIISGTVDSLQTLFG